MLVGYCDLTYVVTQCHVGRDVHTCWLFVPGQLAPVCEVRGAPLGQAGDQHQAHQHLACTFRSS